MNRLLRISLAGLVLAALVGVPFFIYPDTAAGATTSLTITKLASDGETVIAEETVDYQWLADEDNIPVMGDGNTHYYHQGPVFVDAEEEALEDDLRWNPEEDTNVEDKDMGAVMGTNVRDLCELVGGMQDGDLLEIRAEDGLRKDFAYRNVYEYSDQEGPMVICWQKDGEYPDGGYEDGMRLVWFADDSTNPWGLNVFGNWDWHEAADPEYWYFYRSGGEMYPTTTGLSIQNIAELTIFSNEDPPREPEAAFTASRTSGTAPLTVRFTDRSLGNPTEYAWDLDGDGTIDSTDPGPSFRYNEEGRYSVSLRVSNDLGTDEEVQLYYITVTGASDSKIIYSGPVYLTRGETYAVSASNSGSQYMIDQATALGALQAASEVSDFSYEITDEDYSRSGSLRLDSIDSYYMAHPGYWMVYVNDIFRDGLNQKNDALNRLELSDGDEVEFYYVPGDADSDDLEEIKDIASAALRVVARVEQSARPVADFTAAPLTGTVPLRVVFTNNSSGEGTLKFSWDFDGDGQTDSTEENPIFEYGSPGLYRVTLTVTNDDGSDQKERAGYISVVATGQPIVKDLEGHWARLNIEHLLAAGVVSGYPDRTFRPESQVTRAEFVVMLVNAMGIVPQSGQIFGDTQYHWAKDSIATATALGIVSGYDTNRFGPDDLVTREQMAVMIAKAIKAAPSGAVNAFADQARISPWALSAVVQSAASGIMNGYPDNTFRPHNHATRAEAVTVVVKAMEAGGS